MCDFQTVCVLQTFMTKRQKIGAPPFAVTQQNWWGAIFIGGTNARQGFSDLFPKSKPISTGYAKLLSFVNWSLIFSYVLDFSIIHLAGRAFCRNRIFPIRF